MRWHIKENKHSIECTNFKGHKDDIEMSGEKVSMIISYEVDEDGFLKIDRKLIYPMFRIQPDLTQSSYKFDYSDSIIPFGKEKFVKVIIDGTLVLHSETRDFKIVHKFYPSTKYPIAYEQIEVVKKNDNEIPKYEKMKRINSAIGCEGWIYTDLYTTKKDETITFAFGTHFCNEKIPREQNPYNKRLKRVSELISQCDLTTGNDVVDTMFAFAKVRVGESIYNTRNGRINSPGGANYYAGIWANDQCEYSTPWFAFTNDKFEREAAFNAMKWFERYMNDQGKPLVSSIISEGTDYWNGKGDRGDAEMYLYGNSRLYLTRGELPDKRCEKMLKWAAEYIEDRILKEGVVYSDTDELESRLSSGINLSTSSLAYGAFILYSTLNERMNNKKKADKYKKLAKKIEEGIEEYFGASVSGFETYNYHKGCNEIRAWNCLPLYMGIKKRADETIKSIDTLLWEKGSSKSTESENIKWDRSALYYIASLFRCGKNNLAWERLKEMSNERLLGERVPYAVEAYPEYNMRHLSAESALFCRVITDGLFDIMFDKKGFMVNPSLPDALNNASLKNIYISKSYYDIIIDNRKLKIVKR